MRKVMKMLFVCVCMLSVQLHVQGMESGAQQGGEEKAQFSVIEQLKTIGKKICNGGGEDSAAKETEFADDISESGAMCAIQ